MKNKSGIKNSPNSSAASTSTTSNSSSNLSSFFSREYVANGIEELEFSNKKPNKLFPLDRELKNIDIWMKNAENVDEFLSQLASSDFPSRQLLSTIVHLDWIIPLLESCLDFFGSEQINFYLADDKRAVNEVVIRIYKSTSLVLLRILNESHKCGSSLPVCEPIILSRMRRIVSVNTLVKLAYICTGLNDLDSSISANSRAALSCLFHQLVFQYDLKNNQSMKNNEQSLINQNSLALFIRASTKHLEKCIQTQLHQTINATLQTTKQLALTTANTNISTATDTILQSVDSSTRTCLLLAAFLSVLFNGVSSRCQTKNCQAEAVVNDSNASLQMLPNQSKATNEAYSLVSISDPFASDLRQSQESHLSSLSDALDSLASRIPALVDAVMNRYLSNDNVAWLVTLLSLSPRKQCIITDSVKLKPEQSGCSPGKKGDDGIPTANTLLWRRSQFLQSAIYLFKVVYYSSFPVYLTDPQHSTSASPSRMIPMINHGRRFELIYDNLTNSEFIVRFDDCLLEENGTDDESPIQVSSVDGGGLSTELDHLVSARACMDEHRRSVLTALDQAYVHRARAVVADTLRRQGKLEFIGRPLNQEITNSVNDLTDLMPELSKEQHHLCLRHFGYDMEAVTNALCERQRMLPFDLRVLLRAPASATTAQTSDGTAGGGLLAENDDRNRQSQKKSSVGLLSDNPDEPEDETTCFSAEPPSEGDNNQLNPSNADDQNAEDESEAMAQPPPPPAVFDLVINAGGEEGNSTTPFGDGTSEVVERQIDHLIRRFANTGLDMSELSSIVDAVDDQATRQLTAHSGVEIDGRLMVRQDYQQRENTLLSPEQKRTLQDRTRIFAEQFADEYSENEYDEDEEDEDGFDDEGEQSQDEGLYKRKNNKATSGSKASDQDQSNDDQKRDKRERQKEQRAAEREFRAARTDERFAASVGLSGRFNHNSHYGGPGGSSGSRATNVTFASTVTVCGDEYDDDDYDDEEGYDQEEIDNNRGAGNSSRRGGPSDLSEKGKKQEQHQKASETTVQRQSLGKQPQKPHKQHKKQQQHVKNINAAGPNSGSGRGGKSVAGDLGVDGARASLTGGPPPGFESIFRERLQQAEGGDGRKAIERVFPQSSGGGSFQKRAGGTGAPKGGGQRRGGDRGGSSGANYTGGRDRQLKERNKAKHRQRGADRKQSRGGGGWSG